MKKIVCLYGGPGVGKSTIAAGLFYDLKALGVSSELNREYIKDWVWEGRDVKPGDQTYFFAKQARKERLFMESGIECIVTDSPLILTHFYGLKCDIFEQKSNTSLVMLKHHHEICKHYGYKVEHFVLPRTKSYDPNGRFQDEQTAMKYDGEIEYVLQQCNIKYTKVKSGSISSVKEEILNSLLKTQQVSVS